MVTDSSTARSLARSIAQTAWRASPPAPGWAAAAPGSEPPAAYGPSTARMTSAAAFDGSFEGGEEDGVDEEADDEDDEHEGHHAGGVGEVAGVLEADAEGGFVGDDDDEFAGHE